MTFSNYIKIKIPYHVRWGFEHTAVNHERVVVPPSGMLAYETLITLKVFEWAYSLNENVYVLLLMRSGCWLNEETPSTESFLYVPVE